MVAEGLRRIREEKGLTIPDLSKATGIAQATIYRIEAGETKRIRGSTLQKLATAFGMSMSDLEDQLNLGAISQGVKTATSTIKVTRQKKLPPTEPEETGEVIYESIEVHKFVTDPARVGAQWMTSIEVSPGEWIGVRIYVERPCYNEEVPETIDRVVREAKEEVERQKKNIIHGVALEHFAGAK